MGVEPVRGKIGRPRRRAERLVADRGYGRDKYRRELRKRGVRPVIVRRGTEHGCGARTRALGRRTQLRAAAQPAPATHPLRARRPLAPGVHAGRLRGRLPMPPDDGLTVRARAGDRRPSAVHTDRGSRPSPKPPPAGAATAPSPTPRAGRLLGQHAAAVLPAVTEVKDEPELVARPDRLGDLDRRLILDRLIALERIRVREPDPPPVGELELLQMREIPAQTPR